MYRKCLIIFSVFFLTITTVFAFKPVRYQKMLDDNPEIAGTLAIGTLLEDNNRNQFLITERGWTFYPTRYPIYSRRVSKGEMRKQGNAGEKQLFYSLGVTNNKGELDESVFSAIIPLKSSKAKEAIKNLANKKDFVGEINPSWQFCESDSECVQSKNQCGNPIAVNKKYQKDYLSFLKTKKIKDDCSKSEPSKSTVARCVENFCS